MKELAVGLFKSGFKWDLIQLQGFVFAALLVLWVSCFWERILEKLTGGRLERAWFGICMATGGFLGVAAGLDWGSEYGLIAFSLGAAIALSLYYPAISVCLQVTLLFLRPWELIDKNDFFMILPKLSFAICAGHAFQILSKRKNFIPHWDRVTGVLLVYAGWAFVTTFKASDPISSQFAYGETLFKGVLLFLLIVNMLREELDLRIFLRTVTLVFLAVGAISIYQTLELIEATRDPNFRLLGIGAFSNSNDIAALMVLVFPFGLFQAYRKEETLAARIAGTLLILVVAWSIELSQSRGSMLALAVSCGLFITLKVKSRALTALFVAGTLASIPVYMSLSSRADSDLEQSSSSRMTYIKTGFMMGLKNPVLGVGYEGYEENFERYATEILYEWGNRTAHNSWILTFAETGVLGCVLYLSMFAFGFKQAWSIFGAAPDFLLALAGYCFAMTFLSHTYLLYPYLLLALTASANRIYKT